MHLFWNLLPIESRHWVFWPVFFLDKIQELWSFSDLKIATIPFPPKNKFLLAAKFREIPRQRAPTDIHSHRSRDPIISSSLSAFFAEKKTREWPFLRAHVRHVAMIQINKKRNQTNSIGHWVFTVFWWSFPKNWHYLSKCSQVKKKTRLQQWVGPRKNPPFLKKCSSPPKGKAPKSKSKPAMSHAMGPAKRAKKSKGEPPALAFCITWEGKFAGGNRPDRRFFGTFG